MPVSAGAANRPAKVSGMAAAGPVVADLRAESDELDELVAPLPAERWAEATPAEGWTIAHQIAHLLWTDRVALTAATDEAAFSGVLEAAAANPTGFVDDGAAEVAAGPPGQLLADWRNTRARLHEELLAVADGRKLPWFGPPMSAASMATARLMETWAHGQDVSDALNVARVPTARLRHIAHIGVRTLAFSYVARGREPPATPVRIELTAPDGGTWEWGPTDAADVVRGPAIDFCLVVTQRRHPQDTALESRGPVAAEWLGLAQAYAGPPGPGRPPSSN